MRFTRRFVALGLWTCGPGGTSAAVELRRTRDGRRVRRILRPAGDNPAGLEVLTDLVVRGNGAMAWIVELRASADADPRYQLRTSVAGSTGTLIAEGTDIQPHSLALAGSTIYWTQAGTPRSASL